MGLLSSSEGFMKEVSISCGASRGQVVNAKAEGLRQV